MHSPIQEAVYWHNVTPRNSMSPPTAPTNKIYHYEVRVKKVDILITSSGPGRSNYEVGNCMWFMTAQNRCTTKFSKSWVTEVITPKSVLVDRIGCHVMNQHLRHSVTSVGEDSDGTPSESEAESLLCDTEDAESDNSLKGGAVGEPLPCLCIEAFIKSGH